MFSKFQNLPFTLKKRKRELEPGFLESASVHREGRLSGKALTHSKNPTYCGEGLQSSGGGVIRVTLPESFR